MLGSSVFLVANGPVWLNWWPCCVWSWHHTEPVLGVFSYCKIIIILKKVNNKKKKIRKLGAWSENKLGDVCVCVFCFFVCFFFSTISCVPPAHSRAVHRIKRSAGEMLENKIQWLLLLNQRENAWQMRWACSLPSLFVGHIPAEPISNTQTSEKKKKKKKKKKERKGKKKRLLDCIHELSEIWQLQI